MSTTAIIIILCSHIGVALTTWYATKGRVTEKYHNDMWELVNENATLIEANEKLSEWIESSSKIHQELIKEYNQYKQPVLTNDDDAASTGLYTEEYHPDGSDYTVDRRIPGGHQP